MITSPTAKVTAILDTLAEEWLKDRPNLGDRRGINEGSCGEFADEAETLLGDAGFDVETVDLEDVAALKGLEFPNHHHTFLKVLVDARPWYFDAECTEGVAMAWSIPFLRRVTPFAQAAD